MPQLTDKEISDRVRAKHLEIKKEREECEDIKDVEKLRALEKRELDSIIKKLRIKQYLLEDILGIE